VYDTTGPQVSLVSPALGGDKKGRIKFALQASDVSGTSKVSIRLRGGDWRDMMLDARGNYVYTWDTTRNDDGSQAVEVKATDALGNEALSTYDLSVKNYEPNFIVDNWNWLLIMIIMIVGFAAVTWATLRRPRYPVQYVEATRPAASATKTAEAPPIPPAKPEPPAALPPVPVPVPVPEPLPSRPKGGTGRSLASTIGPDDRNNWLESPAAGRSPVVGGASPAVKSPPPPEPAGFEEVTDEGGVEELKMPRPAMSARAPAPAPAPAPKPAPAPVAAGDMWEEEESEEEFFVEDKTAAPPARPAAPAQSRAPPQSKGLSPLEQQFMSLNTKVARTEEERRRKGPPAGWSNPRPAELPPPQPQAPPQPSKPRSSEGVTAPQSALRPVPPSAQKLSPKDREKMGNMLDDLLTKSRRP
jgi:hypothetical protein